MTAQHWLQAELRLLFDLGEHQTYEKSAQRILEGLIAFSSTPPKVTYTDALDQAGVPYTRTQWVEDPPTCVVVMSDGAQCGYDLNIGGARCVYGHRL